jgi:asparagine synthase (glutamine-hydrolysing)
MRAQPTARELDLCDVAIEGGHGWRKHRSGRVTLWFAGWIDGLDGKALARNLDQNSGDVSVKYMALLLSGINGHFAFAATGPDWVMAAVDWVRSIPLAIARQGNGWIIDNRPEHLRRCADLGETEQDPDSVLALAMAGYTVDESTLYRGIDVLGPGELMWFSAGSKPRRHRYKTYRPWRVRDASSAKLEKKLAETTLVIMERMVTSLEGRCLVVPLSAGRDSRLIVSAVRHLGYDNVRCFAYGRAGNFEAKASQAIAEKLGYEWRFVPATIQDQRKFFASENYSNYLDYADSGVSVPFVQDMAPLQALKEDGYVPDDAVLVNGNTGDFISGNHIVPELLTHPSGLSDEKRWERIIAALVNKHFALWRYLATDENKSRIHQLLRQSIERAGGRLGDPATDHGLFEYAEFQDRQCKYVITGQRIYEFLGHEWRLPLWDNDYLQFWEGIPLAEKAEQGLYARMLRNANWGGVWHDVPVNRKSIHPRWLVPLRLAAKAAHGPLGRERWHRFERRYLQYWMDATCNAACVPYSHVWRDKRGARHQIAWLSELYLERHGIRLNELSDAAS